MGTRRTRRSAGRRCTAAARVVLVVALALAPGLAAAGARAAGAQTPGQGSGQGSVPSSGPGSGPGSATGSTAAPGTTVAPGPERTVRVAVAELDPFVIRHADGTWGGFAVELWEEIAKRNHYRSEYLEKPNRAAMLEAVRVGDADIAVGDITVTADLVSSFDFTEPTLNSGLQIMVPTGQTNAISGLWYAVTDATVLVLLGVMAVTVAIAAVFIWLLERRKNPDFAADPRGGVGEGTWWASVTMFGVGYGDSVPRTGVGRSFSVLWMICGMLLVAAVTATFAANLTVHRLNTDLRSPEDLRSHEVVTVRDSAAATYLAEHGIPATLVADPNQMIADVRDGRADAAVFDAPLIAHAVHESEGHLAFAGPQFTHSYNAFALAPGGGMRAAVDQTLLRLLDDGTYNRLYRSYFTL